MQTWRYVVTFERETAPSVTLRGTVQATAIHRATARAVQDARRQLGGPIRPASIVTVLERAT